MNKKSKRRTSKKSRRKTTRKSKVRKSIKSKLFFGGDINSDRIFSYIKSIGYEIETTDLIKFTIEKDEDDSEILVNSALTNVDLEYGYFDKNEYTDIIDTPDLKFKITNDSAEDSEFNIELEELYDVHLDDEDCENTMFKLQIPKNEHLKQEMYDIKIREPDLELHNCSSFTDVEWIVTYYKSSSSKDIILNTFFNSMLLLKQHLSQLITINDSKFLYLSENGEDYEQLQSTKINQVYVLPGTSLVYYNNSIYDITNFDINKDLKIVVQMTFSCDILYVFRIMKKLLSIEISNTDLEVVQTYMKTMPDNENVQKINEMIEQVVKYESFDLEAVDISLEIVKKMFKSYNEKPTNSEYLFDLNDLNTKKIFMYFFLIIYKLYIYLNYFIETKNKDENNLFKKNLSFAVRHNNYFLYLEIKKLIQEVFSVKFKDKDKKYINDKIVEIIQNLVYIIGSERETNNLIYKYKYVRETKRELLKELQDHPDKKALYFGNPLSSISGYFLHFEKEGVENDDNRDWLVLNNIDEKSTKFELKDDTIIIEFRGFPRYCYLYLFINSDDRTRHELLENNIGTLNMKIVNDFMKLRT